tara:strand:- start:1314 stop:2588 length:1275 start_codon:yes stop_codon:yes gene_type:complete
MKSIFNKLFFKKKFISNQSYLLNEMSKNKSIKKLFEIINNYSDESELRYVGGCVRKSINNEKIDDIDLAINLTPKELIEIFKKNKINFFETGLKHGTLTALIDDKKFEITSLRKDIKTDGRHAEVTFTKDWNQDASRRDFTINAIYSDFFGNLFDPYDGIKDLEKGNVRFIGDPEKRIKEDYLRILRYVRFFLNYSKTKHNLDIKKNIKKNIKGISNLSPERLIDELKKIIKSDKFTEIFKDNFCLEVLELIFPQFKNIHLLKKLNQQKIAFLKNQEFIFIVALFVIDNSDNVDYFFYKFKFSNKEKKKINFLREIFKTKQHRDLFSKKNLNKILYLYGKESLIDLIKFQLIFEKKNNNNLRFLLKYFEKKEPPIFPIKANDLMNKYQIGEGKNLGNKLKKIEEIWVDNKFNISAKQINKIMQS